MAMQHVLNKIEPVQTGLRIEKRLLKVLAENLEMPVAELAEGMALHTFEGKAPFSEVTLARIAQLKQVYDLDLGAKDARGLTETD